MKDYDKVWTVVYIVLGSLVALLLAAVMIMLDKHENLTQTPCEELIQQKANERDYAPLPKRCTKGEE